MNELLEKQIVLSNGSKIASLGLGVFKIANENTANIVFNGIKSGYRVIDTAQIYGNEVGVGQGVKDACSQLSISREELFITSKVWNDHLGYQETIAAFEKTLTDLDLDYIDLYLLHWPGKQDFMPAWRALENLYKARKVKAIGVSNFNRHHLELLLAQAAVKPVINQIELHPKLNQTELVTFCMQHDIVVQAWSPLMQGELLQQELISKLARDYKKSPAQIILKWHLQQDHLLVVKSNKVERMEENAALEFDITPKDMELITKLNENIRIGPDPDHFDFK